MSTSVVLAKIFATLQTGICGVFALAGGVGLLTETGKSERTFAWVWTTCCVVLAAAAIAFFLRSNRARVFLAGLHSLLALGWGALAVAAVFTGSPGAGVILLVPLALAIAGAFTFVSVEVRRYCGEVVTARGPTRSGPVRSQE